MSPIAREHVARGTSHRHVAREHRHVARRTGTWHVSTWHVSTSHVSTSHVRTFWRPAVASPSDLEGGVLATFDVSGERFRVFVTNSTTIGQLFALRDGASSASIPNGRIRRGGGDGDYNRPYGWHLDPEDISMADATIELCDGRPSYVQANIDEFVDTVGRYCPWNAVLVQLRDLR